MVKETKQPKASEQPAKEKPLKDVDSFYQDLANVNYMRTQEARQELISIIDEINQVDDELLVMSKTSEHDLSIRYNGRTLIRVCPLKEEISASINGGKIEKTDKDTVLKSFHKIYEKAKGEHQKAVEQAEKQRAEDEATIKELEAKIAKLDKNHKSIALGKVKVTEAISNWISEHKYVLSGNTLTVR